MDIEKKVNYFISVIIIWYSKNYCKFSKIENVFNAMLCANC